jgi:hypothetical protein
MSYTSSKEGTIQIKVCHITATLIRSAVCIKINRPIPMRETDTDPRIFQRMKLR